MIERQPHRGLFITFEGIEGSGKSTQIRQTEAFLTQCHETVVCTLEPGGTPFGQQVRQWVLNPDHQLASPITEPLLFYADRVEHLAKVVIPALNDDCVVLCDRYTDSTVAYQVWGRGIEKQWIDGLNQLAPTTPDITFLFDLPLDEGLKRAKKRASLDRFELESIQFHEKVRQGYLSLAATEPDRIKKIDIQGCSVSEVFAKIKTYLEPMIVRRKK